MNGKRLQIDEVDDGNYRKLLIEEGTSEPDYVHTLKQEAAKNTLVFFDAFTGAILPSLVGFALVAALLIWLLFF